tara:strand:+ start:1254 stop:1736 length:483 start_codon:yes stop_codon:yes gene_type:complete
VIGIIKKIKNTILNFHIQEDREEAILRLKFLDYILFDLEFYGDFYRTSLSIFKRYAQINNGIDDGDGKKLQNRIEFLGSALEDMLQLEFESWTFGQGIKYCDCEHYYSTRGWYDFYYIALDLLEASVVYPLNGPEANARIIASRLRDTIVAGKAEVKFLD